MLSIDQVVTDYAQIIYKYATIFTGLDTLYIDFRVQLQSDAKPFAILHPKESTYTSLKSKMSSIKWSSW